LTAEVCLELDSPPDQVLERLRAGTHPSPDAFEMVSKLSGGGIVVRVLRGPKTPLPFFGRIDGSRFRIAPVHQGGDVTAYQPILRGQVEAQAAGSRLVAELRPHPEAQRFDGVYAAAGALTTFGGALWALSQPIQGLGLAFMGLCFVAYPRLRARLGFEAEQARARTRLLALLAAAPVEAP
jgi:hypothetical protein